MWAYQRLIYVALLLGALALGGPAAAQPLPPVERVSFYEVLTPYGAWVTVAGYGHVWRPHAHVVGVDFSPYFTGGHWEYTAWGWTWVSDFAWGWVPFHHGRWLYTEAHGWVWVPDDAWAPAWVEWRFGGGYVGWVPLGPAGVFYLSYHLYRDSFPLLALAAWLKTRRGDGQ